MTTTPPRRLATGSSDCSGARSGDAISPASPDSPAPVISPAGAGPQTPASGPHCRVRGPVPDAGSGPAPLVVAHSARGAGSSPRTWRLELPAGLKLVSANERFPHPAVRGRQVKEIRKAAWVIAHNALAAGRIPRLDRVTIIVEYQPPKVSRKRDGGNWSPSGKAAIDGMRDAGVLADDDSEHVLLESYRIGEPYPKGRLVLIITEVTG